MIGGVLMFLVVRIVVLGYGVVSGVRARFLPALALVVSFVATVSLAVAYSSPSDGVIAQILLAAPWSPPLLSSVVAAAATWAAFKRLDDTPSGSAAEGVVSTLAYSLLANALLDAAVLVAVLLAVALTHAG